MAAVKIVSNIRDVRIKMTKLPDKWYAAGKRTLYGATLEIARIMQRPATRPTYPIRWDSPKQKKAYFASKGFGKGIPYKRTNQYVGGWKNETIQKGYQVSNIGHKSRYITGDIAGEGQSRIHAGRWVKVSAVVERVLARLPEKLRAALKIVDVSQP